VGKDRWRRVRVAPGIYRRGARYQAIAYVDGVGYAAGSHRTIKEAQSAQARKRVEVERRLAQGKRATFDKETTVAAFIADWWARKVPTYKASTASAIQSILDTHLVPAFGALHLVALTPAVIEATFAGVALDCAAKTRRNVAQVLVWILRDAWRNDLLPQDVTRHIALPKVPPRTVRRIDPVVVLAVIQTMREPHRTACLLLACSGLRLGELLALQWKHLDLAAGTVTVATARSQVGGAHTSPKSRAALRTVPLPAPLVAQLAAIRTARQARATDYVCATKTKAQRDPERLPVTDDATLRRNFRVACCAAGVEGFRLHDLRHVFASLVLASGASLVRLKVLLGHSSVAFTLSQYGELLPQDDTAHVAPVTAAFFPAPATPPATGTTSDGATPQPVAPSGEER